jgi:ubiquinone/menaquinone biosynthesis C-methylase UbiE
MTIPIKIISKKEFEKEFGKPFQEKIWDSIAKPWKTYVVKKIPIVEEFLQKASSEQSSENSLIVDLGCGTGRNMISGKFEYYAVDFSREQLKHAKKYAEKNKIKAKLFKADVCKLPKDFKDNMFDYGLFIGSLHCLYDKEKRVLGLKEFYRILKKNGEGLVSVWNSDDKRFKCVGNHGDIYMSWLENGKPFMRYYYLYSKKEFLDLLQSVGFRVVEFYEPREHDRFSKKNWIVRVRK